MSAKDQPDPTLPPSRAANLALYVLWVILALLGVWLVLRGLLGAFHLLLFAPIPFVLMYLVKRKNTAWRRGG